MALESKGIMDFNWPAFRERLEEMNHRNAAGSRTGDIVMVMDGRKGYLALNFERDEFPGWHGGPTASESFVPLIFGMPGEAFVDSAGAPIKTPEKLSTGFANGATEKPGGYLRNWHFSQILSSILSRFRTE